MKVILLTKLQTVLELRLRETSTERIVRVRQHQRFDGARCRPQCVLELGKERRRIREAWYRHHDGNGLRPGTAEVVVAV